MFAPYFRVFYLWARECERHGTADPRLAPRPLAHTLGDLETPSPQASGFGF